MTSVTFYNHNKRPNSTSIPPSSSGVNYYCNLKTPTNWESPSLELRAVTNGQYNYAFMDGTYYFVDGYTQITNDIIQVELRKDVLATFRSQIMGSSQYCERSNVAWDNEVIDNMYPADWRKYQIVERVSMGFGTGQYILQIAGADGVNFYGMNNTELAALCARVFSTKQNDWWDTLVDLVGDWATTNFVDPFSYILRCIWLPYAFSGDSLAMQIGYWNSGTTAIRISKNANISSTLVLPLPDPYTDHETYRNSAAYREIELFVPGCGNIPLDADLIGDAPSVLVAYDVDTHGRILGRVSAGARQLALIEGDLAVEIALSTGTINVGAMGTAIATITAGIVGIATGGLALPAAGAIAAGGVVSGISSSKTLVQTKGGQGSFSLPSAYPDAILKVSRRETTEKNENVYGYPCYQTLTLNQTGYYQINRPQVPWGHYDEKITIESYMRGGIYIE